MCDGLKFESEQGATQSFNPFSGSRRFGTRPSCVRAGFRNRLYEGNDNTAEASTDDNLERWRDAAYSFRHTPSVTSSPPNRPTPGWSVTRKLSRNGVLGSERRAFWKEGHKLGTGRHREISPLIWVLSVLFILRYAFLGSE